VHEGLSCLACHQKHRQTTRASCSSWHRRLSNCGLDMEKMDSTLRSARCKHNILRHVRGLHTKGVPKSLERVRQTRGDSYDSYTHRPPAMVRSIGISINSIGSTRSGSRPSTTRSASFPAVILPF
jgi:hypothetical protein